jgi:hypothetical protein
VKTSLKKNIIKDYSILTKYYECMMFYVNQDENIEENTYLFSTLTTWPAFAWFIIRQHFANDSTLYQIYSD